MRKLVGKDVVDVFPSEEVLYSARTRMVGDEVINLTVEEAAELEAQETAELAKLHANQYKREREAAYLPIKDQLDMIYWDMKTGTNTFVAHRDAVKAAHPKPVV